MSEREEAEQMDLLMLMLYRSPRFLERLMRRWMSCLR